MKKLTILTLLLLLLAACSPNQNADINTEPEINPDSPCGLPYISIPTLPDKIPGFAQLDRDTGLHVTGTPPEIDFESYELSVTGLVENPISFNYEELRCLPKVTDTPVLGCRGYFEDVATWSGVLIADILEMAKPLEEAEKVTLVSGDGYEVEISLGVAMDGKSLLAYELEGQPLPVLHGFPLRAVIPTREGLYWAKWLVELRVD